jgi:probable rRNA maturation factor
MAVIHFFYEDVSSVIQDEAYVKCKLSVIIHEESFSIKSLNFIFCTDDYLLDINSRFLNHFYYTDVITFDNSESPQVIDGDIFISIDRIKENAIKFNSPFLTELYRVMIHGVLHLIGFDDKTTILKSLMREKENFYLSLFN